ncbi:MAG: DUF975 family protein [Oscillibacter sp.]|nr:DUF975 family protein [Oscillibacter sp.]
MHESRGEIKRRMRDMLETAQVSPKAMTALYLGLGLGLTLLRDVSGRAGIFLLFLSLLTWLLSVVLDAGFVLYCMAVRQGQRAEYLTLFDGFDTALKIALLEITKGFFIALWSMLFVIPGIVAIYRYRFALYNLLENPDIGVMEAIDMSKRQTYGWKGRLFLLDMSYFPWYLLGSIPNMVYNSAIQSQIQAQFRVYLRNGGDFSNMFRAAMESVDGSALGIPELGWTVIIGGWALVVAMFYLAHFQCVELEYFDAAKRESGVGEGSAPWEREEFYQ